MDLAALLLKPRDPQRTDVLHILGKPQPLQIAQLLNMPQIWATTHIQLSRLGKVGNPLQVYTSTN
uniref:Uncharacterized protein n=1 Tax=Oryza barthii TaxID=65489 RepID=A0A0D3HPT3_9ORYZ